MRARAPLLALASASILLAGRARADEPAPASVPEVRVLGDKADALQKTPGSGTLVTTREIERAQPYDAAEMLRRVPGLTAVESQGGGLRLDIGIHGLDPGRSRRVLVLEDGVPVAINPYAEPDLYYAPVIERTRGIEIVKGSGNILFGPQTIGGVINFLTIAPPDRRREMAGLDVGFWQGDSCSAAPEGSIGGCIGGQQPLGYAQVIASHGDAPSEHVRYVVQALHKAGDGVRNEAFAATDALGKIAFDTSSRGEATLKLGFHDDATRSDDVGLTSEMYREDPRQPTIAPLDHIDQQRFDASLVHEQRIDDGTKLRTLAYAYRTTRLWNRQNYDRAPVAGTEYAPGSPVGDTSLPNGAIWFRNADTILDRAYDVAGVEPRLEHRAVTGGVGHAIDAGARMLFENAHYQQRTGSYPSSQAGSLDYVFDHRTWAFATYAQDRLVFRDWLMVTPGVRFEHAEFASAVSRLGGQDVVQPGSGSVSGVVPGIGMVAGTKSAHAFAGMHVGWAPPRITSPISPMLGASVAQLDAESSINYEVGARVKHERLWRFEGTAYLVDFDNQVVASAGGGGGVTELINGGATRHYGVEGGASFGLGEALGMRPAAIDLGARYTLARAHFAGGPWNGNWLPYAPAALLVGTVDVDHPATGLGGEVAVTYVGEQFTDPQNTIAEDATGRYGKIPAYATVDVAARWKIAGEGLTLRLAVKDATGGTFVVARRPEGIAVGGFRMIVAGVRWEWDSPARAR